MFRSLVVALAALLLLGHGRDRAAVAESAGARDRDRGLDGNDHDGSRWALPRKTRTVKHGPVSEL